MLTKTGMSLGQAVDAFMMFARVEGRAKQTIKTYEIAFKSFLGFAGDPVISEITAGLIRAYISKLLEADYAKTTVNIRLRVLRAFFNWLVREGHLEKSPMAIVKQLRVPLQYPFVLSEQQVAALLRVCKKGTWTGARNYAMLLTFLDTGVRLKELIGLTLADVSLQARSLRVRHGKGDKERTVFMGRRLTKVMHQWLQARGDFVGEDALFVTRQGNALDSRNVERILERLAHKAGLSGIRCSLHTLRHTFATLFIRNGGDPFSLQQLLGHTDIKTTQIYVHMSGRALQEAFIQASPVDRLLGGS